jgi:tetratricopeptide (TPR) repeat protein
MRSRLFALLILFLPLLSHSQDEAGSKKQQTAIRANLANANRCMFSKLDSAKTYANRALSDAKKIRNNNLKTNAYITLSTVYQRDNNLTKAFEYVDLARIVASEMESKHQIALANFQEGTLFLIIGNDERAIQLLGAAKHQFIDEKDSANLAGTYNSLSLMYERSGNLEKAISMIKESIKINREANRQYGLAAGLANLSEYYSSQGDTKKALKSVRETLDIFTKMKSQAEISLSLVAIADLHLAEKNYDSCTYYLKSAEDIIVEYNLGDPKIDFWIVTAEYEAEMNNHSKALELYTKAHELATDFGMSQFMKSTIESMYKSAKTSGKTELALDYLEQFKNLSDSLEHASVSEALISLELNDKFKHEQRLNKIEKDKLKTDRKNDDLILAKKNYLILILILAALLIAIVAYILVRRKTKTIDDKEEQKQELNDALELRNKELVSSAIQILRKSEEMKKTISSLQEINERANPEDSQLLLTVIRKLKMELEHSSWEEFEVPFKQLHSRFFKKLVEMYPELTRAEIKVCALLKLNLDTKQISSILHKTSSSIEVDRSRIRKKMGLTNTKTSLPRHISTNI